MSDESPENKKSGYTYWKRNIADAHVLPSCAPKKIEHSSSEESLSTANRTSSGGLKSAWNAGTTYEEKNITDRAKRLLEELVAATGLDNETFTVKKVKGEIHAHCVRGKVKIGYEIETLKLSGGEGKTISVEDLDSTDPSGFIMRKDGGFGQQRASAFVAQLMNDLCSKLLSE